MVGFLNYIHQNSTEYFINSQWLAVNKWSKWHLCKVKSGTFLSNEWSPISPFPQCTVVARRWIWHYFSGGWTPKSTAELDAICASPQMLLWVHHNSQLQPIHLRTINQLLCDMGTSNIIFLLRNNAWLLLYPPQPQLQQSCYCNHKNN